MIEMYEIYPLIKQRIPGLSDDGTGSSNSIYDPGTLNGDDLHVSYAPEVIPEESSGQFNT